MGDKTGAYADHLAVSHGGLIHKRHNSWGRTRSPKSLVHENGTALTITANTNTMKGTSASEVGYLTENQSFLHVLIEETNAGSTDTNTDAVKAFGYCHAFQRWFELQQSIAAGYAPNSGPTAVSIDPPNSSTTPENHVPSAREFRVYELFGIDRVHFVCATPARVRVFAAACTF